MKKIAIVGFKGKMGSLIFDALKKEFEVVGIDKNDDLKDFDIDLAIDFASADSSVYSTKVCEEKEIPLIIGATGQTEDQNKIIEQISKKIKIIKKANFSVGIEILKKCIDNILLQRPIQIEIAEKHHKYKKDAPSGTALELEKFINSRTNIPVKIKSIREGEEMGEHKISFYFENETLEIKHNVYSRMAFVNGVVQEVKDLLGVL